VILIKSFQNSHFLHAEETNNGKRKIKMTLAEEVTFINKGAILNELDALAEGTFLELDVRGTRFLDYDIIEILEDFLIKARQRDISITIHSEKGTTTNPESFFDFFQIRQKSA
jgi:MFS superfamily sulfate permease-like transporter